MSQSLAEQVANTPGGMSLLEGYTDAQLDALRRDWSFWRRPEQREPDDYGIWLIKTGRGWGKTRVGAETLCDRIVSGRSRIMGFVAATAADARDTMVDELRQNAGMLTVCERRGIKFVYEPSKRRIQFPQYHAVATIFSAEEPERLRGPQHDTLWFDEFAAYPKQNIEALWSNAMFGLRHGEAKAIITTTPKPIKKLREIMSLRRTVVTEGSTYDNMSNLAQKFIDEVITPYEGTRIGRQELEGAILDDNPDALWTYEGIDKSRVHLDDVPFMDRVVIGVDPAGSAEGHEIGIIAAGRSQGLIGGLRHGYVLGDYSLHGTPEQWANAAIDAYDEHEANAIVVEKNFGGDMVASTIRLVAQALGHDPIQIRTVVATRGKAVRAEPISGMSAQGRIHHVIEANTRILDDQLCDFEAGGANDRVDGYVWAFTDLLAKSGAKVATW